MFVQIIQGKCRDADTLHRQIDMWRQEQGPKAEGWLGGTYGITEDNTFVGVVRFESKEAAARNSTRPEQGAWWAETEKCFDGEVTFHDCDDAILFLDGGADDAGFVQVMRGTSEDVERMHSLFNSHTDELRAGRPEIIGGLMLDAGEGRYVDAIYFRSEEAAREGEAAEPPEDVASDIEEAMRLMGDVTYFDLKDPILRSPS